MKSSSLLGLAILLLHENLKSNSEGTFKTSNDSDTFNNNVILNKSSTSKHLKRHNVTRAMCPIPLIHDLLIRKSNNLNTSFFKPFNKSNLLQKFPEKISKCIPLNKNAAGSLEVRLLNNSQLLQQLSKDGNPWKKNHCTVVLFYASWCPFSIRMIPHYHALARTFHQLDVVAVDAGNFSHLSSRYGAISVPTMIVFHDDKAFSKFNASHWDIEHLIHFLNNVTGFSVNSSVQLRESDFEGPLPTTLSNDTDYYLWMAWALIFACAIYALRFYLRYIHIITSLFDFTNYRATHHHID